MINPFLKALTFK